MAQMDALDRAQVALEGLSVGDAFGEQHGAPTTGGLWKWTDDTAMALSIVETLALFARIDPPRLAETFARRYVADPGRGYGGGAHQVLTAIAEGADYDQAAKLLFDGEGSCGNGAAMRAAPLGAFFAGDLEQTVNEAINSALPTHAHPDGIAGAVAIAVAAAMVFDGERDPAQLLALVNAYTPVGPTLAGLQRAATMLDASVVEAASVLGSGQRVLAEDTVPFAVWCAATHLNDYEAAMWACVDAGGDLDTTCAMVGGIVVGATGLAGIPPAWRAAREPFA